jgi:PIN domain nuclease of toxin-antitoxin system
MTYLIDTHYLLWFFLDPGKISSHLQDLFLNEHIPIYYSPISLWEISLKYGKGKLVLEGISPFELYEIIEDSRLQCLPISNLVFVGNYQLPNSHLDPFDRLLCYQAIQHDFTFISVDSKLNAFADFGLKLLN